MRRRDFIAILVGSAANLPLIANAQRRTVPLIGFLESQSLDPKLLANFHQALNEYGYFEGRNVATEYRSAFNQNEQLPALAAELVLHQATLIVTSGGLVAAKAAKEATRTIPILFFSGLDPVENGFVASLNRPGGNATGVSQYTRELTPKRLEVLKEFVFRDKIAYLMNDDDTGLGPSEKVQIKDEKRIARELGLTLFYARNETDIDVAFASMSQQQFEALLVASDPFFISRRAQIVTMAARYALPAAYARREFAEAGGLISYGPNFSDSWRQIGLYAGRILKGERPEDLPVLLQSNFELLINTRTAKALGLTVPPLLRALANEVID